MNLERRENHRGTLLGAAQIHRDVLDDRPERPEGHANLRSESSCLTATLAKTLPLESSLLEQQAASEALYSIDNEDGTLIGTLFCTRRSTE